MIARIMFCDDSFYDLEVKDAKEFYSRFSGAKKFEDAYIAYSKKLIVPLKNVKFIELFNDELESEYHK